MNVSAIAQFKAAHKTKTRNNQPPYKSHKLGSSSFQENEKNDCGFFQNLGLAPGSIW